MKTSCAVRLISIQERIIIHQNKCMEDIIYKMSGFFFHRHHSELDKLLQMIPSEYKRLGKFMLLASNNASVVFRIVGNHDYALKVVDGCGVDADRWHALKREADILRRLVDCKHVVRLVDSKVDTQTNTMFLLEEYCVPLSRFSAMTVFEAIEVCVDICEALIECRNAGIAHLDVKLDNILLDAHCVVRLGDFGVSLPLEELADHHIRRGTLRYMAPEVFREGKCSEQSEIYTVGLMLYLLFNHGVYGWSDGCGKMAYFQRLAGMPFESVHTDNEIDAFIMETVTKACSFAPEDRHESYETLRDDLISMKTRISDKAGSILLSIDFSAMETTMPTLPPADASDIIDDRS